MPTVGPEARDLNTVKYYVAAGGWTPYPELLKALDDQES